MSARHLKVLLLHYFHNMKKSLHLVFALLLLSHQGFSWGQTGHRITGEIAEKYLTRKARKNIKKIIGNQSLAIASTWMDEIKSDPLYNHTHDWHWVTIPDGQTYEESQKNPNGDVIEAIERLGRVLKDKNQTDSARRDALKMLVHLVGDIHQPLHVGRGDDRGGNDIRVRWFGQNSNLHRVWDSDMIESYQLSYTEYTDAIYRKYHKIARQWISTDPRIWAYESMKPREEIYTFDRDLPLGFQYHYRMRDLCEQRLMQAGVRLAALLNELLG